MSHHLFLSMELYKNKDWLENQYLTLEKSTYQIAGELKIGKSTIGRWLNKLGIQARSVGSRKMEKSPRWRGGVKLKNGYIHLYKPNYPNAAEDGYIREHRFIMEQHLGRYLNRDEIVHHKDGDSLNNYIGNLEVMTNSEHMKIHNNLHSL